MKKVTITISQGKPVISVEGVKGGSCKDLTRDLEKKLGGVKSRKLTREYMQSEGTSTRASNR